MLSRALKKLEKPDIFTTMTQLATKHKALNLGQGFPDWGPPKFLVDSKHAAVDQDYQQYAPPGGHPLLKQKVSQRWSKILNYEIHPEQNVIVGAGSCQVQMDLMLTLINEGDEIILFEPFYAFHLDQAYVAKGTPKFVKLIEPKDEKDTWKVDIKALEAAFSDKTKLLVVNSPQNPTGKIFSQEEYQQIADVAVKYPNCYVMSDEAYEHAVFDGQTLPRFGSIESMKHRTFTTYSFGKLFSCVGWRCGVGIGPAELIKNMKKITAAVTYCPDISTQIAFANALEKADLPYKNSKLNYYQYMNAVFEINRNYVTHGVMHSKLKWKPYNANGGFFQIIDITDEIPLIQRKYFYDNEVENPDQPINCQFSELENPDITPDVAFIKKLIIEYQITMIPMTPFYNNIGKKPQEQSGTHLIRTKLCTRPDNYKTAFKDLLH